jgi:RNA polymerase sigma-70 factor (ECF subfamily)
MSDAGFQQHLRDVIERDADTLHNTLRHYVLRAGLATNQNAASTASELLNEVVVEAMQHAARFDPTREPVAWLLGIAANLIKRKLATLSRNNHREPLLRDLYPAADQELSDAELFDRLSRLSAADPAQQLERQDAINYLLRFVSENDRQVLRLAILNDLSGEALAAELNTTSGAARVRLHRALRRLRLALEREKGTDHEPSV